MFRKQILAFTCAALLTAGCGGDEGGMEYDETDGVPGTTPEAGTDTGATGGMQAAIDPQARQFIHEAALANMAEIQLGELASERAQSDAVKQYGQRMVEAHRMALEQLRTLATQANVQLPDGLDQQRQQIRERLSSLEGGEFDRQYMQAMVDEHRRAEQRLSQRASGTTAGGPILDDLNQWASSTVSAVRSHLEQAQQIQSHPGGQ